MRGRGRGDFTLQIVERHNTQAVWQMLLYLWRLHQIALGRCSALQKAPYLLCLFYGLVHTAHIKCKYYAISKLKSENQKKHSVKSYPVFKRERGTEQEVAERLLKLCASIIHWQPMRVWPFWPLCSSRPIHHPPGPTLAQCPRVSLKAHTQLESMAKRRELLKQ